MEAVKENTTTWGNIVEQIKIVMVIYVIIGILHIVSAGTKLPDLAVATAMSFLMVAMAIVVKNVVKRPNLPGFAWATLISFALTLPVSPVSDLIVNGMSNMNFSLVGLPLLAFAGISVGEQLTVFKQLSWKIVLISFVVMASTYFASAGISNIVLVVRGMI